MPTTPVRDRHYTLWSLGEWPIGTRKTRLPLCGWDPDLSHTFQARPDLPLPSGSPAHPHDLPLISVLPLTGTLFLSSQTPCSSKPGIFTLLSAPLVNSYSYDRTQWSITSSRESSQDSHLIFCFRLQNPALLLSTSLSF